MQIIFSAGRLFYAVPDVRRECGLWLSVAKHPLPVPPEWRRPGATCVVVMPGRDYYRIGVFGPQHADGSTAGSVEGELVQDYRDAAWWTPGLEEAWVELEGMKEALERATQREEKQSAISDQRSARKDRLKAER
jgi:hypothetical protein